MLRLTIPSTELFDEVKNEFTYTKETTIQLEHSLVSLSKWESKWLKPFLSKGEKTIEETIDYVRCMTITQSVDENIYQFLTNENLDTVRAYIEHEMTATKFSNGNQSKNREVITAEIIYYWMVTMNIPFECQKWHLNKLLTLINVCSIKNGPQKKMGKRDVMSQNAALNAARKKQLNTEG